MSSLCLTGKAFAAQNPRQSEEGKMTVQAFSGYSPETQYQMLQQRGISLMSCSTQYTGRMLFTFDNCYAEVAQMQGDRKIWFIMGFAAVETQTPYLSQFYINPILNN